MSSPSVMSAGSCPRSASSPSSCSMSPIKSKVFSDPSAWTSIDITKVTLDYILYEFWDEFQDPETAQLPLIGGGPWNVFGIVGLYLIAIYVGMRMMKNRQPYSCQRAMIWYNLFNVIANLVGFIAAMAGTNFGLDVWGCKKKYFPVHLLYLGYGYLLLKFVDFLDTLFFILRKKDNQITFLHVTHHCLMPITCYVGLKFVPYGNTGFTPLINSFVHVIMYFYYYLAALGPSMQRYLWWKKYITVVQLVQFAIGIAHALQIYYVPGCDYSRGVATFELLEAIFFFVIFFRFYKRTYWNRRHSPTTEKKVDGEVAKVKSS